MLRYFFENESDADKKALSFVGSPYQITVCITKTGKWMVTVEPSI